MLRQRERAERDEQVRVAGIERERLAIESELRGLQRSIEDERRAMAALGAEGGATAGELRAQAAAIAALRATADERARALAGVLRRLALARRVLGERAAERRAMELLKERRLEAFRAEQRRLEDRVTDDLVMASRARGGGAFQKGADA